MDEFFLKRTEQDYYVSSDEDETDSEDSEETRSISIVSHRIDKGSISYTIKQAGSNSTQALSSEDIDTPFYRKSVSDYIKKKAKKSLEKNLLKNKVKYVKSCTIIKNEIKYSVVFMDDHEELLSSFEMKQSYPQELLKFLEKEAFGNES